MGHIPENAEISPIALKHDTISTEPYTGHAFLALEMAPVAFRHHGTKLAMQAIGTHFNWTLNQEIVFSAAGTLRNHVVSPNHIVSRVKAFLWVKRAAMRKICELREQESDVLKRRCLAQL